MIICSRTLTMFCDLQTHCEEPVALLSYSDGDKLGVSADTIPCVCGLLRFGVSMGSAYALVHTTQTEPLTGLREERSPCREDLKQRSELLIHFFLCNEPCTFSTHLISGTAVAGMVWEYKQNDIYRRRWGVLLGTICRVGKIACLRCTSLHLSNLEEKQQLSKLGYYWCSECS